MRFTHLAEFSEYAKYQPFKFYLLIFVIACFPVTYACGPPYICYDRHAGQQRSITGGLCHARTCFHKNDTTLCKSHGQEPEGQHEYSKEQDGIVDGKLAHGKIY